MNFGKSDVPYFSQWETPEMTSAVIDQGSAALLNDPKWRNSGAETIEEYTRWAVNICGMACLKMILASRGEMHPTVALAHACARFGGYVVNDGDASIKGLIYAPFVNFVRSQFGLAAEVRTALSTTSIGEILSVHPFFIASVSSSIRWPECEPPSKGGHLVLVTAASQETIRFHNPSGHDHASQADVVMPVSRL